jgi:3',5'-cyclic AMP phosphodiesterase CpdA
VRKTIAATLSGAIAWVIVLWQGPQATVEQPAGQQAGQPVVPASLPERPRFAVPDALIHQPTPRPDRIVLTWVGDPAHSQSVTWRTDTQVTGALAQIAHADAGPGFSSRAIDVHAATTLLTTDLGSAHYHTAHFQGLEPRTTYAYRVGDGVNWSEWFQFRTASDQAEPFSFIYFGDAQNDIRSLWSRVVREAVSDAPRARFMIHAGDLVSSGESDAQWGEWFSAGAWVNGMIPSVPSPGNHEYIRDKDSLIAPRLSRHWRVQFALPENGPSGLEETVYSIDYQGARIISLNSNAQQDRQAAWLEQVLANNPCAWTIVTFHHPLYSAARNRDNARLRGLWKPLFDRFRVDLVLQGHDHTYARTGQQLPENIGEGTPAVSAKGGTVYVVSVSGPKMYDLTRRPFMKRAAEDTQLYQIVHIDRGELRYEARTAVGEVYDAFVLRKRLGEINELFEQVPDSPERLRPPKSPESAPKPAVSGSKASGDE